MSNELKKLFEDTFKQINTTDTEMLAKEFIRHVDSIKELAGIQLLVGKLERD